jgi:hypothetical protein
MKDLTRELQDRVGRDLTDREIAAIEDLVDQYGLPEKIGAGEPWFTGDTRRPVFLTWMIDGAARTLSLSPSTPTVKPRNLAREHLEKHARTHGGVLITEHRRTGVDGRRTIERTVRRFAPQGRRPDAPPELDRGSPRTRARGAGRPKAQATRSSAQSGDSGSDDSESSEPPAVGRLCQLSGCDRDLPPSRPKYCCDQHADLARKRRERRRDRANPDRIAERKLKRLAAAESLERLTAEELPRGCRCSNEGVYRDPEGAWICRACGRPLNVAVTTRNGYDARMAEIREWMRNDHVETRTVHRHRVSREWRTRPTRKMAAQLRRTRQDRKAAA